jgi:hypothetical protein
MDYNPINLPSQKVLTEMRAQQKARALLGEGEREREWEGEGELLYFMDRVGRYDIAAIRYVVRTIFVCNAPPVNSVDNSSDNHH